MMENAYQTIAVDVNETVCTIRLDRLEEKNTINDLLVVEVTSVLDQCEKEITIVIIEGHPEVFCFGADFRDVSPGKNGDPEPLYNLWQRLSNGPYITIAHVRGQANAGGIGFVAACDLVIADESAVFSLSEMLFGLIPACVMPFLVKRIGAQKSHYMTLMTQPVSAMKAKEWGLADVVETNSGYALKRQLLRLRLLSKLTIARYKTFINQLLDKKHDAKQLALETNRLVFSDTNNQLAIKRFVNEGVFPWEK